MDDTNATLTTVAGETVVTKVLTVILISVLMITTFIGNLLIIIVLVRNKTLRCNPFSNLHILSLAFADIGVSVIALPSTMSVYLTGYWPFGTTMCMVKSIVVSTLFFVTMFTLVFISFDRYLLLSRDYPTYRKWQSSKAIQVQIILVWCLPSVLWTTNVFLYVYEAKLDPTENPFCTFHIYPLPILQLFDLVFLLCVPLVLLLFFSVQTLVLIIRRKRQRHRMVTCLPQADGNINNRIFPTILEENGPPQINADPRVKTSTNQNVIKNYNDGANGKNDVIITEKNHQGCTGEKATLSRPTPPRKYPLKKKLSKQRSISQLVASTREYLRPAILLGVLVFAFVVCLLPLSILVSIRSFHGVFDSDMSWVWIHLLAYLDALLNPLLYAATNVKIRADIEKVIQKSYALFVRR